MVTATPVNNLQPLAPQAEKPNNNNNAPADAGFFASILMSVAQNIAPMQAAALKSITSANIDTGSENASANNVYDTGTGNGKAASTNAAANQNAGASADSNTASASSAALSGPNASANGNSQSNTQSANSTSKPAPASKSEPAKETQASASAKNNDSKESAAAGNTNGNDTGTNAAKSGAASSSTPAQNGTAAISGLDIQKIERELKALVPDTKQLDAFLQSLSAGTQAGMADLLKMLSGLMQNSGNGAATGAQDLAGMEKMLDTIKDQQSLLQDFLTKAGMSQADAKNLLQNAQTNLENKIQAAEVRTSFSDVAAATAFQNAGTTATGPVLPTGDSFKKDANTPVSAISSRLPGDAATLKDSLFAGFSLKTDAQNHDNAAGNNANLPQFSARDALPAFTVESLAAAAQPATANADLSPAADAQKGAATAAVSAPDASSANAVSLPVNNTSSSVSAAAIKTEYQQAAANRPVDEKSVVNQIVEKFTVSGNNSKNEIQIRLDPPSLGTVRVNISTVGDSVKTTVVAESGAVKQIIENNIGHLKDALANQGLKVESMTVLVGGGGLEQKAQQQQQSQSPGSAPGFATEAATIPRKQDAETPASRPRPLYDDSKYISVFA